MTISLRTRGVRGVVLDIEGTTTPVSFVYDVLFPYAKERIGDFVTSESGGDAVQILRSEQASAGEDGTLAAFALHLMERNSKSPGLKEVQGKIWERGYADGTLRGQVFPDVLPALTRWREAGLVMAIYSSGSVLAQRLLFGNTPFGDLTPFIRHYFDTSVGPKQSPESYQRLAGVMDIACGELLFLSDAYLEVNAARASGFQTLLCVRPGSTAQPVAAETIRSFDEITP